MLRSSVKRRNLAHRQILEQILKHLESQGDPFDHEAFPNGTHVYDLESLGPIQKRVRWCLRIAPCTDPGSMGIRELRIYDVVTDETPVGPGDVAWVYLSRVYPYANDKGSVEQQEVFRHGPYVCIVHGSSGDFFNFCQYHQVLNVALVASTDAT